MINCGGVTVTVVVNAVPVHPFAVGVMVYTAVRELAVVLVRVPVRLVLPAAPDAPPVRPVCIAGTLHAYVVPDGRRPPDGE